MINYKVYSTKEETAEKLADELGQYFHSHSEKKINIAISGGTTPFLMFSYLIIKYRTSINWKNIHFFWVDERCVPPTSDESNFGNTHKTLFSKIDIPNENIHRIIGENNPEEEAQRYSDEINKFTTLNQGKPVFDIILLGMGDDGHTASIFPPQIELMEANTVAMVAQNPYNGQNRITLSGKVINLAQRIYFLVTGKNKAEIFRQIYYHNPGYDKYPSAHIDTNPQKTTWYLDSEAAALI